MNYREAERILHKTYAEVRDQHLAVGQEYITRHWQRYLHVLIRLPGLSSEHRVLEIGASVLSACIRRRLGCETHAIYHELEPEWPARFATDGIIGHKAEVLREPLPVPDNSFDCILFNEVMEHLPLDPEFIVRQVVAKLKPGGRLIFSVPNFARSEKRLELLLGKNPQDPMDKTYVYYAHHREPVMKECLDLLTRCGACILRAEFIDYEVKPGSLNSLWQAARFVRHGAWHRLIHRIVPAMRSAILITATREGAATPCIVEPPLAKTGEFAEKR